MSTTKKNKKNLKLPEGQGIDFPPLGSEEEKKIFKNIQAGFAEQFEKAFPDKLAPKTVVIIPSLTLDQEILSKISAIFLMHDAP